MKAYKLTYLLLIFALLIGCVHDTTESVNTIDGETEEPNELKTDSIKVYQKTGKSELKSFVDKYESNWKENKPTEFPHSSIELIKVFSLHSAGEYNRSEFTKRVTSGVIITKSELEKLMRILNNPKSYGSAQAFCYDPGFGLVVYDGQEIPTEWLSICLDCNRFLTYPGELKLNFENNILKGFTPEARMEIRNLIMNWGVDYNAGKEYLKKQVKKLNLGIGSKTI